MLKKNTKKFKIRKAEARLMESKGEDLEEVMRDLIHPINRKPSYLEVRRYKKLFFWCGITSTLTFILILILSAKIMILDVDATSITNLKWYFYLSYVGSAFFTFMPWFIFIVYCLKETSIAKFLFAEKMLKKFYRKMERFIDASHQCNEMLLVADTEINYNYFIDKLSVAARRGLANILLFTNNLLSLRFFDGVKYIHRRTFFKKIDEYLKEFNGAIIVSFKGRVPKYVIDVFEQVNANIIELRKNEY